MVTLKATGTSALKVVGILVSSESYCRQKCQPSLLTGFWKLWKLRLQSKEGGGPTVKGNPQCGGCTFLTVWRTNIWGGTIWFTVWRTHKWWKYKIGIALKPKAVRQLTKNKYTPTFHSAQLRYCSVRLPLYPVNQSTCNQTILLEYKIKHDSTTTKTVFYLPLWCWSDE